MRICGVYVRIYIPPFKIKSKELGGTGCKRRKNNQ